MSTQIKKVKGLAIHENKSYGNVIIRFTSDELGETLSLEAAGTLIAVTFEEVEKVIKKARGERK